MMPIFIGHLQAFIGYMIHIYPLGGKEGHADNCFSCPSPPAPLLIFAFLSWPETAEHSLTDV